MKNIKFLLGFIWASPITLVGFLFYILPFWLLGFYRLLGWREISWVWHLSTSAPKWLQNMWQQWAGQTIGNLIVMKPLPEESQYSKVILLHEQTHSRQCMILGVLQPLCYGLNWLCGTILKKTIGHTDGYYDCIMEIHSRRVAGQTIDIVGMSEKLEKFINTK